MKFLSSIIEGGQTTGTPCLEIIERARRYLEKLPPAISGERGHARTYHTTCVLVQGFGLPEEIAFALLAAVFNPRCRPPWSESDLRHKIQSAAAGQSDKPRGYLLGQTTESAISNPGSRVSRWPAPDEELRCQIIACGPDLSELAAISPVRFHLNDDHVIDSIVSFLFWSAAIPDPLICAAIDKRRSATRPLSVWVRSKKLSSLPFIVPSPMSARHGLTQTNKRSERCLGNVGPRRHLVVEFDQGTIDEQAALHWHLAQKAPLTMVVHSGVKSLHGWYLCAGRTESELRAFMPYFARVGADTRIFTACQLVRMPFGLRENGARQPVVYLNPSYIMAREVPHVR